MSSRVRLRYVVQFAATVAVAALLASAVSAASGGSLDPTFGERGFAVVDGVTSCLTGEGGCALGIGLAIQRDGAAVVAAGTLEPDCRSRFAVVRLRAGKLDSSFGRGGRVLTSFGSAAGVANAVAVGADGKIVVAGERPPVDGLCGDHIHLGGGDGFALARYGPDGTLDKSFGDDGTVFTRFEKGGAVDLLLQQDGKIIAVGSSARGVALARYTRDGRLDRSFGNDGMVVTTVVANGHDEPGRPILDAAGRIVVPFNPGCRPCSAAVVRYSPDGTPDRSFGRGGTAELPFTTATSVERAGRSILVMGMQERLRVGPDGDRVAVVRLSSRGRLDHSFGRRGIALPAIARSGWMYDAAVQKNGKVVILKTRSIRAIQSAPWGYALIRLLPNGLRDRSFGRGGMAVVELGRGGTGRRVAIQRDGKLVVASMVGMSRPVLTVTRHLP